MISKGLSYAVNRRRRSNNKKEKDNRKNNIIQNITQKTKDRARRTQLKYFSFVSSL